MVTTKKIPIVDSQKIKKEETHHTFWKITNLQRVGRNRGDKKEQ